MKKNLIVLLSLLAVAGHTYAFCDDYCNPWVAAGSFGIGSFPDLSNQEQNALGRLSIGRVFFTQAYLQLSIEAGIQSGATQRLAFAKEDIDALGGVPIETQLTPMLDMLVGVKTETFSEFPLFTWLKGGMVYRQLKTDRPSVNDLHDFAPEIQAGFGYRINEKASLNLGYQYIWGNKPLLTVNPIAETGMLRHIASQQAVMLGLSFNFS